MCNKDKKIAKLANKAMMAEAAYILLIHDTGREDDDLWADVDAAFTALAAEVGGRDDAVRAANWALMNRAVEIGGVRIYRHDEGLRLGNVHRDDLVKL